MLVWSLFSSPAAAATLEVGTPAGFATLQEALAAAQGGDTIEVSPGVYEGPLELGEIEVEIVGVAGAAETFIVPSTTLPPSPATVALRNIEPVTLRGLSIDGGSVQRPLLVRDGDLLGDGLVLYGGISDYGTELSVRGSEMTLIDVTIDVPVPASDGGHVEIIESEVDFQGVTIRGGSTIDGIGGAVYMYATDATFTDCTFADNDAAEGGALFFEALPANLVVIRDSSFEGNTATSGPGGAVFQLEGQLQIVRSTFSDSASTDIGGAVSLLSAVSFVFEDNVVERSRALLGGGVALVDVGEVTVSRSSFVDNTSDTDAGALLVSATLAAELVGNSFCHNTGATGGAIQLVTESDLTAQVLNNLFQANTASSQGAAIAMSGGPVEFLQNTVVDSSTVGERGAVYAGGTALVHNTGNVYAYNQGIAAFSTPPAGIEGGYDLYFQNDVNIGTPEGGENDSSWSDVLANPKFAAYIEDDCASNLRPGPDSPMIDGGDPIRLDDDGTRSDLGAYGGPGAVARVDIDDDGVIVGDCAPFDPENVTGTDEVVADGVDQDCDGLDLCWVDADLDGFGVDTITTGPLGCAAPGIALVNGDCDDTDPALTTDCSPDDTDTDGTDTDTGVEGPTGPDLRPAWFCSSVGARPSSSVGLALAVWLLARRRRSQAR